MKLSELTPTARNIIEIRLDNEEWSWNHSSIWWSKGGSKAAEEMILWHNQWEAFAKSVRDDQDIEESFENWYKARFNGPIDRYNFNVPMLAFNDDYQRAKSMTEISQKELEEINNSAKIKP